MASESKRPRKPVPPAGWVVFPKHGPARVEIEPLPADQADLETNVARKFAGAMAHFINRELVGVEKNEPWPDFTTREGDQPWGIELIEVVDPMHAQQYRIQQDYTEALLKELGGVPDYLAGVDTQVVHNYQLSMFPKALSSGGQQIIKELIQLLEQDTEEIQNLPIEGVLLRKARPDSPHPELGFIFDRFSPPTMPGRLRFSESILFSSTQQRLLLRNAISAKLQKRYHKPTNSKLMLLAYELRMISVMPDGEEVELARDLLRETAHPFNEVWYLYPYPWANMGHLVQVWPAPNPAAPADQKAPLSGR
ncbi:MAG TPA: hypothetical protein VN493_08095 [Thermoanaerobaculia bacterium]|nr:hypothetical protein [Thermoanaerobaculia bacterium]